MGKNFLVAALCATMLTCAAVAESAPISINVTHDLAGGDGSSTVLAGGPVTISAGDHVDLTVDFLEDQTLTIGNGSEYFRGWLTARSNSRFTISDVTFEFIGGSGFAGHFPVQVSAVHSGGNAHIGPSLFSFLSEGEEITFSGYRTTYNVQHLSHGPQEYHSLSFYAAGSNVRAGTASMGIVAVPEPMPIALMGIGLLAALAAIAFRRRATESPDCFSRT
jgi:hypothetical protein